MYNFELSVPVYRYGANSNDNKLSLVGMQQPEKYEEKLDVSSEVPSS